MRTMDPSSRNFRQYDLPWTGDPESGRRFRRWLTYLLAVFFVAGVIIPLLPVPPVSQLDTSVPERLARVMIETKPKPPPPPPPKVQEKPKEPEHKPIIPPKAPPRDVAHQKAQKQLNQVKDELAKLRDLQGLAAMMHQNLTGAVMADAHSERNMIMSKVASGSGGIGNAPASRGFGPAGTLGPHDASAVTSTIARSSLDGRPATRTGAASGKAGRSREEIEIVFDKNKGTIHSLYARALRENPALQGKVVLEFTISPAGQITMCRVVSSDLNNKELEEKIVALVRLFHFEPKNVEPITTTKPIDFFPA
jgi:protein TonB